MASVRCGMTDSTTEAIFLARDLGVRLSLRDDNQGIIARPTEKITQELRGLIRQNRDDLIRTLLFRRAGEWVASLGQPFAAPDEADEALNTAWHDKDLEGFREALRQWVYAGLREGKAA